ncbi:hypothetical protein DITRI_Ditri05aG0113700 [Diplodiscus trichospermus]
MAFRLNQSGEVVWAEAEPGKVEDHESGEEISGPWFQKKKGSVFPVKRKLVKTMMVSCIAKSLSSVSISPEASLSRNNVGRSSKVSTTPSKSSKVKKRGGIFPDP